jgi:hypothetical protein
MVIGLGLYQDIEAPKSWGSVVTEAEAIQMPAWGRNGRITEAPLRPIRGELQKNFTRAFMLAGKPLSYGLTGSVERWQYAPVYALYLALLIVAVVRRRRRHALDLDATPEPPLPWELLALCVGSLAAYFLARQLAFKLYLPYRALTHVQPYLVYAGFPIVTEAGLRALWGRRDVVIVPLLVVLALAPTAMVGGVDPHATIGTYDQYRANKPLYDFARTLPVDATLGGELAMLDTLPLFAWRQVYVNKVLAHPFRRGYYNEVERRLVGMHDAMYATRLDDVVDFCTREHIDVLALNDAHWNNVDRRLFEPVLGHVRRTFNKNKAAGFVLAHPPADAVLYRGLGHTFLSVDKLRDDVARGIHTATDLPATPDAPAAAPSGAAPTHDDDAGSDSHEGTP